jgi:ankyrin repeat protein/serine/threonine protein kinase
MEYLSQGDLQTYLDNQRSLAEGECRMIMGQVVRGLQVMHKEGFAHRDIKPAVRVTKSTKLTAFIADISIHTQNILIQQCPTGYPPGDWWVKLTDFGISKQLEAAATGKTTLCGTLDYMPPELLLYMMGIEKQPTPWRADYQAADMWAVGVMAFRMLTGSGPFTSSPDVLRYSNHPDLFPQGRLDDHNVSPDGLSFTRASLFPSASERLTSPEALRHDWITLTGIALLSPSHLTSTKAPMESTPDDERGMTTLVSDITAVYGRLSMDTRSRAFSPQTSIATVEGATARSSPQEQKPDPPQTEQGVSTGGKNDTESPLAVTFLPTSCPVSNCQDEPVIFADFVTLTDHLWQTHVDETYRNKALGTLSGHEGLLLWAARYGHEAVARLLLSMGADLETRGLFGQTPLFSAAMKGNKAIVSLLLEMGADMDARDNTGSSPLAAAAYKGDVGIAHILLEKGADIDAQSLDGFTALHIAVQEGYAAVIKLLLEKGAGIDAQTRRGATALHIAAQKGYEAAVKLLLKNKANIESWNKHGITPLGIAGFWGHEAVVRLLLDGAAKIWCVDTDGDTPLCLAARRGHTEVVRLLIKRGADPRHKNRKGKRAWEMPDSDNQELIALLKKAAGEETRERISPQAASIWDWLRPHRSSQGS